MRQVIKHRDIRLLNMIRRTDPVIPMTTLKMPFATAATPYSPILSQNTKPVATTPINIWHFSWNQPKISLPLQ